MYSLDIPNANHDCLISDATKGLDNRPTIEELDCYISRIAPFKFCGLGLALGIANVQLNVIWSDPSLNNTMKCQKMLNMWLNSDTNPTWKKFCDALERIGKSVLAKTIRFTHTT